MWVIALEALVALAMLVLIVWLTMAPSKRRDEQPPPQLDEHPDSDRKH